MKTLKFVRLTSRGMKSRRTNAGEYHSYPKQKINFFKVSVIVVFFK